MAPPADAPGARWVDRSAWTAAHLVLGLAAAAWVTMLALPQLRMPGMGGAMTAMGPRAPAGWNWGDLGAFTAMWAVMMGAMMLPSATPMIALYRTVARRREPGTAAGRTAIFTVPYVALWTLVGIPVYATTVGIDALVRSHRWAHDAAPYAISTTLLAAGVYQFSPLKRTCLAHCRTPLDFLVAHWRPGGLGAARIGAAHAGYCLGCCALLMAVLVAAGAMGLAWVLLISGAVALEKLAPERIPAPAVVGVALLTLGAAATLAPGLITDLRR